MHDVNIEKYYMLWSHIKDMYDYCILSDPTFPCRIFFSTEYFPSPQQIFVIYVNYDVPALCIYVYLTNCIGSNS